MQLAGELGSWPLIVPVAVALFIYLDCPVDNRLAATLPTGPGQTLRKGRASSWGLSHEYHYSQRAPKGRF